MVCGGTALAFRLVDALATRYGVAVTLVAGAGLADPPVPPVPDVTIVEAPRLTAEAFARAGLATADAIALLAQDDAGNLDAALDDPPPTHAVRLHRPSAPEG